MADKELRKMNRMELIEIIYALQQNERVIREENEALQHKLDDKIVRLESAGSIAEAALSLNHIFEDAEQAVQQYMESLKDANGNAERILADARQESDVLFSAAEERVNQAEIECQTMREQTEAECQAMREQIETECRTLREQTEAECQTLREQTEAECQAMREQVETECQALREQTEAECQAMSEQEAARILAEAAALHQEDEPDLPDELGEDTAEIEDSSEAEDSESGDGAASWVTIDTL